MTEFNEIAEKLEAKLAAVAEDRKASDKARDEQLKALSDKQVELAKSMLEVEQKLAKAPAQVQKKAATLGSVLTDSKLYADFVSGHTRSVSASLAAITTPGNGVPAYRVPGVVGSPEQTFDVERAFSHVPTASNAIEYLKVSSETNAAAAVAEGAAKPESAYTFSVATAPVRTIAHYVRVSRQLADDAAAVTAYINNRLAYGLDVAVEKQLIAGDGTGQNLSGIFTTGNFTDHGLTTANFANASELDVVRRAATLLRMANFTPSVVFLNPLDYDALIGEKDKQGRYMLANPTAENTQNLWGLRPILSSQITSGQFIVADAAQGATIYDRMSTEVGMYEQDADNVTSNLITIRAEKRLAFAIENTAAFVGGALVLPAA
jgi:HK97 family phage major capsid protein